MNPTLILAPASLVLALVLLSALLIGFRQLLKVFRARLGNLSLLMVMVRPARRSGKGTAGALVVFLLIFLGVGFVGIYWLFPLLSLGPTSFEALIIWAVLLFAAIVAADRYKLKAKVM